MKQKRPKSVRLPSMGRIIERDEAYGKKKSKICLDNEFAHLIEPKGGSASVKIGVETKFKIRLDDNSIGVFILDDHDFIYLKNFSFFSFNILCCFILSKYCSCESSTIIL